MWWKRSPLLFHLASVCLTYPHFQESISNAIYLCTSQILVAQKLFLQQSADGVLDGTGRFKCMFLHESDKGDAAGFAFFGNGNQRLFLLVVKLIHGRSKGTAFLFQYVTKRLIDV